MLFSLGNRNEREIERQQSNSQFEESRGNHGKAQLAEERAQTAAQERNNELLAEQNQNLNLLQARQAETNNYLESLKHESSQTNKAIENTNVLLSDQKKIFLAGFKRSADNQSILIENTKALIAGQEEQIDATKANVRAQFSTWRTSTDAGKQYNQWSKKALQSINTIKQRTDAMQRARVQDFLRIAKDEIGNHPELVDPAVLEAKMEPAPDYPVHGTFGRIPEKSPDLMRSPTFNPRGWHPKASSAYKKQFLLGLLALVVFAVIDSVAVHSSGLQLLSMLILFIGLVVVALWGLMWLAHPICQMIADWLEGIWCSGQRKKIAAQNSVIQAQYEQKIQAYRHEVAEVKRRNQEKQDALANLKKRRTELEDEINRVLPTATVWSEIDIDVYTQSILRIFDNIRSAMWPSPEELPDNSVPGLADVDTLPAYATEMRACLAGMIRREGQSGVEVDEN